jgi:hypothetical protein
MSTFRTHFIFGIDPRLPPMGSCKKDVVGVFDKRWAGSRMLTGAAAFRGQGGHNHEKRHPASPSPARSEDARPRQ